MDNVPSVNDVYHSVIDNFGVWINDQLLNNDFLVAGLVTVLSGTLLYFARNVPKRVWDYIYHRLTVIVEINTDNYYFYQIARELNANANNWFSRTKSLDDDALTIGFDRSISRFKGKFCVVVRSKVDSDSQNFKQVLRVTFPFTSVKNIDDLFEKFLASLNNDKSDLIPIIAHDAYGDAYQSGFLTRRPRESVYVPEGILDSIDNRMKRFLKAREWYVSKGIPYKHSLLFYGPPGTGKTTLIKYLAGLYNMELVMTSPVEFAKGIDAYMDRVVRNGEDYAPRRVGKAVEKKERKLVALVIEDIDCFNITQARDSDTETNQSFTETNTLSKLLNILDGINTPDGMVVFATTNYFDKLDKALTRKGRFDNIVELGYLSDSEIRKMVKNITGHDIDPAIKLKADTGANVQDIILNNLEDIDAIIRELRYEPISERQLHAIVGGDKSL